MSLFSSQSTWPPQCLSANQSPINLSQSSAKICELDCDLVMDEGFISEGTVGISDEGLWFMSQRTLLGTCKFRGESYMCNMIHINHPSHHTIEGVPADGEIIAYCYKPTGELLCISALFRVNPDQSAKSYGFFKQFVPYALSTGDTVTKLQNWSLSMMVPPSAAFFTYSGSTVVPPCKPCDWVVFKSMISIDTGDFAYLVRNCQAGSRTVVSQGNRNIFFNDTSNISGVMPNDGKVYLRISGKGLSAPPPSGGARIDLKKEKKVKEDLDEEQQPTSIIGKGRKQFGDHIKSNGGIVGTLQLWFMVVAIALGCYYGYQAAQNQPFDTQFIKPASQWTRETVVYLWDLLKALPTLIWDWTVGWITWLLKPKSSSILSPRTPEGNLSPAIPST